MSEIKDNFDEYYHTVYGFLMSLTGGDQDLTEELAQETFYRAVKNSSSFKGASEERKLEIYGLIQKLPNPMKEVFLYRLTGDLSFREIGNICGKTENWARVTYYRAKQQLGKELAKEYE